MFWVCGGTNSIETVSSLSSLRKFKQLRYKEPQSKNLIQSDQELFNSTVKSDEINPINSNSQKTRNQQLSNSLPTSLSSSTLFQNISQMPTSNLFSNNQLTVFSLQSISNDLIPLITFLNDLDWVSEPLLEYQRNLLGKPKDRVIMLCYCLKSMSPTKNKLDSEIDKNNEIIQALIPLPSSPDSSIYNSINELVSTLRQIVLNTGKNLDGNQLLQSLHTLINLVQNFESFSSLDLKLENNKSVFSVDLIMMLTDIIITGLTEFMENFFSESQFKTKRDDEISNLSSASLFSNSHIILPLITEAQRLTQSLGSLWVYLTPSCRDSSLLAYSHYLLKLSQFIGVISNALFITSSTYIENNKYEINLDVKKINLEASSNNLNSKDSKLIKSNLELFLSQSYSLCHTYLSALIQLVSELLECIPKFKSLVTIQSLFFYIVSIRLWQCVEFLLAFIKKIKFGLKKLVQSNILSKSLSNSTQVIFNSYLNLWDLWEIKLKNLYQSILPNYEDIMSELIKKEKKETTNTILFQGQVNSFSNTVGNLNSYADEFGQSINAASLNNLSHIILKKINPNYLEAINNMNTLIAEAVDEVPNNLLLLYKGRYDKDIRKKRLINLSLGKDIYPSYSSIIPSTNSSNSSSTPTVLNPSIPLNILSPIYHPPFEEDLCVNPPLISENFHERFLLLSLLKRLHSISPLESLPWNCSNFLSNPIELANFAQENYISLYNFLLSLIQSASSSTSSNISNPIAFPASLSSPNSTFSNVLGSNYSSFTILSSLFPLLSKILLRLSLSFPRGNSLISFDRERIPDLFFTTPLEFTRIITSQWKKREAFEEYYSILEVQQHQQKELDQITQRQSLTPSPLLFSSNNSVKVNQIQKSNSSNNLTSLNSSINSSSSSNSSSTASATLHNFIEGQKVDGLFKLANGSKRWFPATIKFISKDNPPLFELLYDDGDIEKEKPLEEIREIKKKLKFSHLLPLITQTNIEMNEESEISSPPLQIAESPRLALEENSLENLPVQVTFVEELEEKSNENLIPNTSITGIQSSNDDEDYDYDEEDDGIFAIPSVFDSISRPEFSFKVPPMRLDSILACPPTSDLSSSFSLSSTLTSDGNQVESQFQLGTDQSNSSSHINFITNSSRTNLPTLEISSLTRGSSYSSLGHPKISSRSSSNQLTLRYSSVLPPIDSSHNQSSHNILSSRNINSSPYIQSKHSNSNQFFFNSSTNFEVLNSSNKNLFFDEIDTYTLNNFNMYSYCFLFITLRKFFSDTGLIDYKLCQSDNLLKIFQETHNKKTYNNGNSSRVTNTTNSDTFLEASNLNQLETSLSEWLFVYREFFELSSSSPSFQNFKNSSIQSYNTKICNLNLHFSSLPFFLPIIFLTSSVPPHILNKYIPINDKIDSISNIFRYSGGETDFTFNIIRLLAFNLFSFSYPIYNSLIYSNITSNKLGEGGFGAVFALDFKNINFEKKSQNNEEISGNKKQNFQMNLQNKLNSFPTFGLCINCYRKKINQIFSKKSTIAINTRIISNTCSSISSYFHKSKFLNEDINLDELLECKNCFKSIKTHNSKKFNFQFSTTNSYAIKKISRERSRNDASTLLIVINEILALQILRGLIGVSYLHEFGVWKETQSYCLVLERGFGTLNELRINYKDLRNKFSSFGKIHLEPIINVENPSNQEPFFHQYNPFNPLIELHFLLSIFLDILLIFQSIHERNVTHFDIKGSNILLRSEWYSSLKSSPELLSSPSFSKFKIETRDFHMALIKAHSLNAISGEFFITDFGESLSNCNDISEGHSLRQRSRGTLVIQAPEVLAVNDQHSKIEVENNCADKISLREALTKPSFFHTNSFALPRIASKIFTDSDFDLNDLSEKPVNNMPIKVTIEDSGKAKKKFPLPSLTSDYWSLGCLLGEILSGQLLLTNNTWPELFTLFCLSSSECCEDNVKGLFNDLLIREYPITSNIFIHDFNGNNKEIVSEDNKTLFSKELIKELVELPLSIMQQMPSDRLSLSGLISNTSSFLNKLLNIINIDLLLNDFEKSHNESYIESKVNGTPNDFTIDFNDLNFYIPLTSNIPYILSNKLFLLENNIFLSILLQSKTKSTSYFSPLTAINSQNSLDNSLNSSYSQPPLIDSNIWLRSGPLIHPTSPHSDALFPFLSLPELIKDHQTHSFPLLVSEYISDNLSSDILNGFLNKSISFIWVELIFDDTNHEIISSAELDSNNILLFKINYFSFSKSIKNYISSDSNEITILIQKINEILYNYLPLNEKDSENIFPSIYFTFSLNNNLQIETSSLDYFHISEMNSDILFFLFFFTFNYFLNLSKFGGTTSLSVMSLDSLLIRQFLLNLEIHEGFKECINHPLLHIIINILIDFYEIN